MRSLVMIVDDHPVIRRMLRAVFEAEDLRVSDAADGAECIQRAQEEKPSLIILDLSMPVMNGLAAARELKVLMPHVPLLMFTNNAGEILEKDALSSGIFAVVCKSDSDASKQLVAHARTLLGLDGAPVCLASDRQRNGARTQRSSSRRSPKTATKKVPPTFRHSEF